MPAYPSVGTDINVWGTELQNFEAVSRDLATGDLLDKAVGKSTINAQTGTAYTLVNADAGKIVRMTNAAANTITVPSDANMSGGSIAVGTVITIAQGGAGLTAIAAGAGATLLARGLTAPVHMAGQYAYAMLVKVAANTWEISGDIVA